jgi:hypothetical protein
MMENEKLAPHYRGLETQSELLQAAKYFVAWVDDVWKSAAISGTTLNEYWRAKLAIKNYEDREPKPSPETAQRDELHPDPFTEGIPHKPFKGPY